MNSTRLLAASASALFFLTAPAVADGAANDDAVEAMYEYMEFSEYEAGIIPPQQIDEEFFVLLGAQDTGNRGKPVDG